MLFSRSLLVLLLSSSQAIALPAPENHQKDSLSCKDVTALIKALHDEPKATSYCSSYLHIHDYTKTVTKSTTVTPSCQTKTVTGTKTVTSVCTTTTTKPTTTTITTIKSSAPVSTGITTDQTVTTTETISTVTTATSAIVLSTATGVSDVISITATITVTADQPIISVCPTLADQAIAPRGVQPDCVKPYPSDWISAACSCLHIPTHTTTTTVYKTTTCGPTAKCTKTATCQKTTTVHSTTTATAYSTKTQTVTTTKSATTSTYTKTSTTTATSITDVTSTTTVAVTTTVPYISVTTIFTSTTVTVTPSGTTTTTCGPPAGTCSNGGYQWAYYDSPFGTNNYDGYSQFDPAYFKTQDPQEYEGFYTEIGLPSLAYGETGYIYNSQNEHEEDNFALNHRGYIYAPETGTYTVSITNVDDLVDLWIGPLAYSGWRRDNAQAEAAFTTVVGAATYSFTLVAGTYTPFRVMYAQGDGPGSFGLTLSAPDGSTLLTQDTPSKPGYIVQFGCDADVNFAEPYPPFGAET